jgi:hypothetical protein
MVKRLSTVLAVVGFIVFLIAPEVFGCSCGEKPTIVQQMEWAPVVLTGRIESLQKLREEEREHDYRAYRSATLQVEKVYSGNVKVGDKLLLAQGSGSDCGLTWDAKDVGDKWLFYLGKPSTRRFGVPVDDASELSETKEVPMYGTSFCGRSTSLTSAAPDLAYLDNLVKRKGKTRVSGVLDFGERSVEGIEVRIKGKNAQFKTKYVKGGFFEVYDIPPGEYLLEVFAPSGWKTVYWRYRSAIQEFDHEALRELKKNQRPIRILAGKHVEVDLGLAPDTMIKGRVLSPTNKPMANVTVSADPVSDDKNARGARVETDAKGEFQFETLDPGNYVLVANPNGKIDSEQPFGRLYYPGVAVKENAGLIAVEPGDYAVGLEIQVPQTTRLIEVAGRVLFADDKPAKEIWISFEPSDKQGFDKISARTGEDGRFSLMIPVTASGAVVGSGYFSKYRYSKCPEVMATVEANGSSDIKTTVLEINGGAPILGAILRLPFNLCEEK